MHNRARVYGQVLITRRNHPLFGQSVEIIRDEFRRLRVRLPDGGSALLPRDWTDAAGDNGAAPGDGPARVLTESAARQLTSLVRLLQARRE